MNEAKKNTEKWSMLSHLFKTIEIPAKTTLLREGEISRKMYFVEKGCLRTWINNNGKDITTQFFFEGSGVSSIESFMTNKPSQYSIETIEPCVLQTVTQTEFQEALISLPDIKDNILEHLFQRLLQSQNLFFSYLKNSPQKRYEELVKQHPHIILRIPQHYIASYLGITSVSLSRIRNRR